MQKWGFRFILLFVGLAFVVAVRYARATDFSSSNFTNLDPVLLIEGGESASANFRMISGTGQVVVGESTSTGFSYRSGFFYFPFVTTPVVAATAGNAQVALSWTAASAGLGFTVGAYEIGQATVSGGPYTYDNVGNVLNNTRVSLTNNTTYYFVIRVLDALGNPITTSSQVSAMPTGGSSGPPSGGSGGSGGSSGGSGSPSNTGTASVSLTGRAYPLSRVIVLKDGQQAASTIAGPDANFSVTLSQLSAGSYTMAVQGEDANNRRSALFTFPISVTEGAQLNIGGIFIAPTIDLDKEEVKRGDTLAIFGRSAPETTVTIAVHSEKEFFAQTPTDKNGVYLYNFDTTPLEYGQHTAKSKAITFDNMVSPYGEVAPFRVSESVSIDKPPSTCNKKADLNNDCKVNLVDFSIAAYWYRRSLSDAFNTLEKAQLNGDGKVDLVDFSIMAFHWTG